MKSVVDKRAAGKRHQQGLSLVELMVAMVLGLLVVGAAFAIFHSNQETYRANEGLARMQENARVAFELITEDIRGAGGNACNKHAIPVPVSGESADVTEAKRMFDRLPVSSSVNAGTNRLRLVGSDSAAYRITAATSTSITLDASELPSAGNVFDDGDMLLLCNAADVYVVEVQGDVTTATVNFTPALPAGKTMLVNNGAPMIATLARLHDVEWFAENNGRGGSSLYMARNGGAREEVAEGVENFAVTYLHEGATNYVANVDPANVVRAVRVGMTLRGQNIDGRAFTRVTSHVVGLRKGSPL
jgi:type IV pilus assembly protein PilW